MTIPKVTPRNGLIAAITFLALAFALAALARLAWNLAKKGWLAGDRSSSCLGSLFKQGPSVPEIPVASAALNQVEAALCALGFKAAQAKQAVGTLREQAEGKAPEELLREALKLFRPGVEVNAAA